jgi:hypothetical protein
MNSDGGLDHTWVIQRWLGIMAQDYDMPTPNPRRRDVMESD